MADEEKKEKKPKEPKAEGGGGEGGGEKKQKAKGDGGKGKKAAPKDEYVAYKREKPPRLKAFYDAEVKAKLFKELNFTSAMQVPRLVKITLNMGVGKANQNAKVLESAVAEMRAIAGQAPVVTEAKKDVANFKLRKGHKIGVMVTLRRERMWEFLDRLISVALPRVRDFKGVSPKGFDGRGNYNVGIREQIIFPEIDYDTIDSVKGLNVTIVTTAKNDAEGRALLAHLGLPFRQGGAQTGQGANS
jgi:large subunit ribosomal protein L5